MCHCRRLVRSWPTFQTSWKINKETQQQQVALVLVAQGEQLALVPVPARQ